MGSDLLGKVPAVVDAGPVYDEEHLAAVEAVHETRVGRAAGGADGLQREVDFGGEGDILRGKDGCWLDFFRDGSSAAG